MNSNTEQPAGKKLKVKGAPTTHLPPLSERPLVSVIVPSYNQGRFIKETIDSALSQDYRPIEVIVIDGASTDNTLNVLHTYDGAPGVEWVSEPDKGVADAVNKGLAKARGEILAIQSSDDYYLPGAVSRAVKFLKQHAAVALAYGDVDYVDEHSCLVRHETLPAFTLKDYLGRFTYVPQPSAFFRAEAAKAVGGWRSEVSYAADADYWLRIAVKFEVAKIDAVMGCYRYHREQRNTQSARIERDWEKTIRDLLALNRLDRTARRFACMGVHLAKYKYGPESAWLRRTAHLYIAAAVNPLAVRHPLFPKQELLVGRQPVWKFLSKIKRKLGFKPRTA